MLSYGCVEDTTVKYFHKRMEQYCRNIKSIKVRICKNKIKAQNHAPSVSYISNIHNINAHSYITTRKVFHNAIPRKKQCFIAAIPVEPVRNGSVKLASQLPILFRRLAQKHREREISQKLNSTFMEIVKDSKVIHRNRRILQSFNNGSFRTIQ